MDVGRRKDLIICSSRIELEIKEQAILEEFEIKMLNKVIALITTMRSTMMVMMLVIVTVVAETVVSKCKVGWWWR